MNALKLQKIMIHVNCQNNPPPPKKKKERKLALAFLGPKNKNSILFWSLIYKKKIVTL